MATRRNGSETVGKSAHGVTGDLAARIAEAQRGRNEEPDGPDGPRNAGNLSGLSRGLRLGTEFIAAILVGTGMGYVLDSWLGTAPWLLLGMLCVGFAAGVLNVTRSVAAMNKADPPGQDPGPGRNDEKD